MEANARLEDDGIWADCCSSSECELCAGSGQARLEGLDAVLAGLRMLADTDVWPSLLATLTAQAGRARLDLGKARRQLEWLARDVLATVAHLERHFPATGGLPSVQQTKQKANAALGRVTIPLWGEEEPCRRVASEVR